MVGSSFCRPTGRRRHADLAEPRAERALAGDERRPAGGAALLGVVVGEDHPFAGDPVDVGRAVAHQAHRVGADVRLADVVAEDDQDVRLLRGVLGRRRRCRARRVPPSPRGSHNREELDSTTPSRKRSRCLTSWPTPLWAGPLPRFGTRRSSRPHSQAACRLPPAPGPRRTCTFSWNLSLGASESLTRGGVRRSAGNRRGRLQREERQRGRVLPGRWSVALPPRLDSRQSHQRSDGYGDRGRTMAGHCRHILAVPFLEGNDLARRSLVGKVGVPDRDRRQVIRSQGSAALEAFVVGLIGFGLCRRMSGPPRP